MFQQLVIYHNQRDLSEPQQHADKLVVKPSWALIPVRVVCPMLSLSFKEVKKTLPTTVCRPDMCSRVTGHLRHGGAHKTM